MCLSEKIASAGVTNMHPIRLDLASDPLPAERYDLTYSLMTLHHIHDAKGILRKFHDLLGPEDICWSLIWIRKMAPSTPTEQPMCTWVLSGRTPENGWKTQGLEMSHFSTAYEIKKKIGDIEENISRFPA